MHKPPELTSNDVSFKSGSVVGFSNTDEETFASGKPYTFTFTLSSSLSYFLRLFSSTAEICSIITSPLPRNFSFAMPINVPMAAGDASKLIFSFAPRQSLSKLSYSQEL
jgi:hypothetical protein